MEKDRNRRGVRGFGLASKVVSLPVSRGWWQTDGVTGAQAECARSCRDVALMPYIIGALPNTRDSVVVTATVSHGNARAKNMPAAKYQAQVQNQHGAGMLHLRELRVLR